VLEYAAQFVGKVPYGTGNSPATSFSCDGYTQYVFAGFGISLPRTADAQAALGVVIDKSQAVAGDLVWWPHRHVGIYDGAGGMYNSPTWGRYVEHASSLWGSPLFVRLTL
jgi:cell wall-associated NlpC family hydrolase